jgi:hypothetical protein
MTPESGDKYADPPHLDDGYLLQTEWPTYVFDSIPMAAVLVICSSWYVGKLDSVAANQVDHEMMLGDRQDPYTRT